MSDSPSRCSTSSAFHFAGDSPLDEPANQQLLPDPDGPSPIPSHVIRLAGEPSNQQVLADNVEVDRPSHSQSVSRSRIIGGEQHQHRVSDHGSIIIPVGGTLTRTKKKPVRPCSTEGQRTVRDRNAPMLFNESMADVHFTVGSPDSHRERFPAHSYVLAISSSVFNAMFNSGFEKQAEIVVPDVEPTAFRILLKYLYTDEIDLHASTALEVLYASKKYLVSCLTRAAIEYLETSLNAGNVCMLLSRSELFDGEDLFHRCWEVMDAQAELALSSDGFLEIDQRLLRQILARDTLNVRERVVFDSVVRWAHAECKRRNLPVQPAEMRAALGDIFFQIRIPTMSIEEFANGPARSDLLQCQETNNVFLWYTAKEKPQIPFPTRKRSGLQLIHCHRFQSCAYRSNQWRYRGRPDSIQFSVDRRIFVAGFGLYGSSNGAAEYKAKMELKCGERRLACVETQFFSDGSSNIFPVFFEQPVQIEAETSYTAWIILAGKELSYFGQEGMSEVSCTLNQATAVEEHPPVTVTFQCSEESQNGTGVQGGQLPELLFYV